MDRKSRNVRPNPLTLFSRISPDGAHRRLAQATLSVPRIHARLRELEPMPEEQLRRESLSLRYRAKCGEPTDRLLPEAFALVREASRRMLGMSHYDVQLVGGMVMHHRCLAEMQTGEGKTLTATLPLYLNALPGRGVQLATVNDYLARRDAEWMRPVYELLGMSVGVIESQMSRPQRAQAYACDITYGTAKEFGFDFLRDQLLRRQLAQGRTDLIARLLGQQDSRSQDEPIQRDPYYILVDEADSILIDEARTPLIIGTINSKAHRERTQCYLWAAELAGELEENIHYTVDPQTRAIELTFTGRQRARGEDKPKGMDALGMAEIYEFVERAVRAHRDFHLDQQYIVRDGEIVIVDESTGRLAEGRKWRQGLHQAIEAKSGVEVTPETGHAARVTVQDFFLRYERVGGMTGTARSARRELRKIYQMDVVTVPTNRPVIRRQLPTRVFGTADAKWQAVVAEIRELHEQGRPVLIGTRTIDHSEQLAQLLVAAGLEHQVLNARHLAEEADIVARAGESGKITVSTNMAGRGTDIKVPDECVQLGGLHVICTEMHDSARIDRQLFGRCGRQGDPGTFRIFLSLDDELLRVGYGPKRAKRLVQRGIKRGGELRGLAGMFKTAQNKVESRHFRDRKILLYHERRRREMQLRMGQDPYLDTPS